MVLKGLEGASDRLLPKKAGVVDQWVEYQIAEGLTPVIAIGGKALSNQSASVHRFNVIFSKAFCPIGSDADEAAHQDTGNEAESNHRFSVVVDEQSHFEEGPVLEHFWVCRTFHGRPKIKGYFKKRLGAEHQV